MRPVLCTLDGSTSSSSDSSRHFLFDQRLKQFNRRKLSEKQTQECSCGLKKEAILIFAVFDLILPAKITNAHYVIPFTPLCSILPTMHRDMHHGGHDNTSGSRRHFYP
jgi:hypothetical protein